MAHLHFERAGMRRSTSASSAEFDCEKPGIKIILIRRETPTSTVAPGRPGSVPGRRINAKRTGRWKLEDAFLSVIPQW